MKYYIGIDLGGTNIKAGVVSEEFEIVAKASCKTDLPRPGEEICADMAKVALQAVKDAGLTLDDIEAVGIGTPGIANSESGVIEYSCNLDFHDFPVAKLMKTHIDKPCYVENDANAAAYGEFVAGAAKGANDAVCITLGTGVGGGIIINKKIFSGFNFAGAEIGHMVINADGPKCTCGRRGCLEAYASANALIRQTEKAMSLHTDSNLWQLCNGNLQEVNGKIIFEAYNTQDKTAKAVVNKYLGYLSEGVINYVNIFRPRSSDYWRWHKRTGRGYN